MIGGIQQVGIGVENATEALRWYCAHFAASIRIFDDTGPAPLMVRYTGGAVQRRRAVLALNPAGGGGFEIWQYTSRTPRPCVFERRVGDCGIFAVTLKSRDVHSAFQALRRRGLQTISRAVERDPAGDPRFFVRDPYGNIFEVAQGDRWLRAGAAEIGGVQRVLIGVSDIRQAKVFYGGVLGYTQVVYECEGVFTDFDGLPGGSETLRRVRLKPGGEQRGALVHLLGPSEIELRELPGRAPRRIFEGRFWGDLGFVHLCFDVKGMDELLDHCAKRGFGPTVDSVTPFGMGGAAGRFSYVEDPDGTLIEFVEIYRVAILKALGWYLDLAKRPAGRPLPKWMLKTLTANRFY